MDALCGRSLFVLCLRNVFFTFCQHLQKNRFRKMQRVRRLWQCPHRRKNIAQSYVSTSAGLLSKPANNSCKFHVECCLCAELLGSLNELATNSPTWTTGSTQRELNWSCRLPWTPYVLTSILSQFHFLFYSSVPCRTLGRGIVTNKFLTISQSLISSPLLLLRTTLSNLCIYSHLSSLFSSLLSFPPLPTLISSPI